ncbi:cytidylate kinase [mine drainage metagenome]|uniref:(d)CMP kinase n=1 Tax=mine drainage metagenome TaxID=410659 RepID=A0A1J5SG26_9ZZZZ
MTAAPFLIVAIDGGAASGKSSTSRAVSERFNLLHVDTGSFYRAVTAELLRQGVQPADLGSVRDSVTRLRLGTNVVGRSARMTIDSRPVDEGEIRSPEVNANVSKFAAIPEVRSALLAYQRGQAEVARTGGFSGLVMEGRDIGSVIFPQADFRFFLHADPEERARRRALEGQTDSIAERDRMDSQRRTAPLACPPGATAIDSTHLTLDQVVDVVSAQLAARLTRA